MNPRPADYKGITLQTLNEVWSQHKGQFREWLSRKVTKEKTVKDYYNALEKLFANCTVTFDKRSIKEAMDKVGNKKRYAYGLRNFLKFLAEIEVIDEEFSKFLQSYAKAKTSGIREVYISDAEVSEAWEHIKERRKEARLLFQLMVFSGVRLSQLVRMLSTFNSTLLQFPLEGIARYPIRELSKGKKRGFWVYMPSELTSELRQVTVKESTAWEWVTYKRVSANTLRKWHYTFLIRQGVPADVADFIQGRASQRVGATHYLNKTLLADEWYSVVVDDLKKVLEK